MRAPPIRGDGGVAAPPIAHHEVLGERTYENQDSRGGEDPHPPSTREAVIAEATRLATLWPGAVVLLAGVVEVRGNLVCACHLGAACSPKRAGKHPLERVRGLTADEVAGEVARIVRDTGAMPGLGLRTGPPSGICVIDIDIYVDDPIAELATTGIRLSSPLVARTGRGGRHLFYRAGGWQSGTGVVPHVDVRTHGGIVVLPPSRAVAGPYVWATMPPTPALVAELPPVPPELAVHLKLKAAASVLGDRGKTVRGRSPTTADLRGGGRSSQVPAGAGLIADALLRWPWLRDALREVPVDGDDGKRPGRHQQVYKFVQRCDRAGIPPEAIIELLGDYAPAVSKGAAWVRSDGPRVVAKVIARRALSPSKPAADRVAAPAEVDPGLTDTIAALRQMAGTFSDSRAPLVLALCDMAERSGTLTVATSTRALSAAAGVHRDTVIAALDHLVDDDVVVVDTSPSGIIARLAHPSHTPHTHCVSGLKRAFCHNWLQPDHPLWAARAAGQTGRRVVEALFAGDRTAAEVRDRIGDTPRRALARLVALGLAQRWGGRPHYRLAPDVDPTDPACLDEALERVEKFLADGGQPTLAMSRERAAARYEADRARNAERRAAWIAERRAAAAARGQDAEPPWEPDDGLQALLEAPSEAAPDGAAPDPYGAPQIAALAARPVSAGQVARGLPAALVSRFGVPVGHYRATGHPLGPRTIQLYDRRVERLRFGVDIPTADEASAGLGPTASAIDTWRRWRAPQTLDAASVWWVDSDGGRHRATTVTIVLCRGRRPQVITADGEVIRVRGRRNVDWGFQPRPALTTVSVPMYQSDRTY